MAISCNHFTILIVSKRQMKIVSLKIKRLGRRAGRSSYAAFLDAKLLPLVQKRTLIVLYPPCPPQSTHTGARKLICSVRTVVLGVGRLAVLTRGRWRKRATGLPGPKGTLRCCFRAGSSGVFSLCKPIRLHTHSHVLFCVQVRFQKAYKKNQSDFLLGQG